mgnify:CR=1 FL=1
MKKSIISLTLASALLFTATPQANAGGFYNYGTESETSGYNDALQLLTKTSNYDLYVKRHLGESGVVANYNYDKPNVYSVGTTSAIGKHTLITASHVVQKQNPTKDHDSQTPDKLRVQIKRNGDSSTIKHTVKVKDVVPIKNTDMAIIHTYEDVSQYMRIQKIASESSIKNMKFKEPIYYHHYSNMKIDPYKNDRMGTSYLSIGRFIKNGNDIEHPYMYYTGYSSGGSSGASVMNSRHEIIGINVKSYSLNTMAKEKNMKLGYTLLGQPRKDILKEIY